MGVSKPKYKKESISAADNVEISSVGGVEAPPHLVRDVPLPRKLSKDPLEREIAIMVALHPQLGPEVSRFDLAHMDDASKHHILGLMRAELGIQAARSHNLNSVCD